MAEPCDLECRTPGQLIEKLLEIRGWTQRLLAIILGVDETILNKVITNKRPIDASLALLLGEVFEIAPERFLELQKTFDLAKARLVSTPDPRRSTRATLFGDLPVTEMMKREWLRVDSVKNVPQVEAELTRFFGVAALSEIEILPHAAKKTEVAGGVTASQLAWIYRVQQIAGEMMVGPYSEFGVKSAIKQMQPLMMSADSARKVPRLLADCGIRFIVCESIGSAKIDGVCLWLDNESPVIGMTLRYDRIDNFWFVLRHEIEHVLRLHGRDAIMLDAELEGKRAGFGPDVPEDERVANEAAANFGLSQHSLKEFIDRKAPFFREIDLLGFAQTEQVHPGIAVGRLQYATGRYDLLRNHLVRIRSKIMPSAIVDGWGQIAQVGTQ